MTAALRNVRVDPFRVDASDTELEDLRERLRRTRWPDAAPLPGWEYGTDLEYLQELCQYWQTDFDWRAAEARINAFDQFVTRIRHQQLHFFHVRSPEADALPLLLVHGWPGSIAEFLGVLGPLSDPRAHGGDPRDAFHVVAPSIPGYGFSGPSKGAGLDMVEVASIFVELMALLGYERYGAQGGDWGAGITMFVGGADPGHVAGVHVNFLSASPPDPTCPSAGIVDQNELADLAESARYEANETGYIAIQSTKPQTLAYGLNDSPAALAAWIVEKFRTWSDCEGDIERRFTKNDLLTNITIYWLTGTINSSMRLYFESLGPGRFTPLPDLKVPLGHSRFPRENSRIPRAWAERVYPTLVHWTSMPRGGHFAAMEAPDLLVEDIRTFFRPLRER